MLLKQLVSEFEFDCEARELSPKTIENYIRQDRYLLNFLKEEHAIVNVEDVKPIHIKQFMVMMSKKGRKPQYINDLLKAFKCLFKYAFKEGYTATLITADVKNVRQPKVLIQSFSPAEIRRMIAYYEGHDFLSIRNRVMIMMFFDTGVRLSELVYMKVEQIREGHIIIHGKGNKDRVVPKSPLLSKWLIKYMNVREAYFEYRAVSDCVFPTKNGRYQTAEGVSKVLKDAGKAVGVDPMIRVSAHTCRHTFAHLQLANGCDLYTLSRLMGHESISITQRYLDGIRNDEVLDAAKKTGVLANL